jgi:hypothetical protein
MNNLQWVCPFAIINVPPIVLDGSCTSWWFPGRAQGVEVKGRAMTHRRLHEPNVDSDRTRAPESALYTPWDVRAERVERRSAFWSNGPIQRRRSGLVGRIEYMVPVGHA